MGPVSPPERHPPPHPAREKRSCLWPALPWWAGSITCGRGRGGTGFVLPGRGPLSRPGGAGLSASKDWPSQGTSPCVCQVLCKRDNEGPSLLENRSDRGAGGQGFVEKACGRLLLLSFPRPPSSTSANPCAPQLSLN